MHILCIYWLLDVCDDRRHPVIDVTGCLLWWCSATQDPQLLFALGDICWNACSIWSRCIGVKKFPFYVFEKKIICCFGSILGQLSRCRMKCCSTPWNIRTFHHISSISAWNGMFIETQFVSISIRSSPPSLLQPAAFCFSPITILWRWCIVPLSRWPCGMNWIRWNTVTAFASHNARRVMSYSVGVCLLRLRLSFPMTP